MSPQSLSSSSSSKTLHFAQNSPVPDLFGAAGNPSRSGKVLDTRTRANCYRKVREQILILFSSISASSASVHQQHQCIISIRASTGSAHQQGRYISKISMIGASAGSVHQQDRRISVSAASVYQHSAASAHQHHQRISSISASEASAHQEHQHQRIRSNSTLAATAH